LTANISGNDKDSDKI